MLTKIEKVNLILITAGLITLACLIIYAGVYNLATKDYTSLGDPYYTNQILAFERAPIIIWTTLIILALVAIQFLLMLIGKTWRKY